MITVDVNTILIIFSLGVTVGSFHLFVSKRIANLETLYKIHTEKILEINADLKSLLDKLKLHLNNGNKLPH